MPHPHQGPAFLTFNIGSVDSFERNLELAQRELGIDPANQLPVTYISEADWFKELLKLSPTLLILGALIYFSRRLSAGASGKGVGGPSRSCLASVTASFLYTQGIFGVGQSTAKMINKETNIRTKFRWVVDGEYLAQQASCQIREPHFKFVPRPFIQRVYHAILKAIHAGVGWGLKLLQHDE